MKAPLVAIAALLLLGLAGCPAGPEPPQGDPFAFLVAADMRNFTFLASEFPGALKAASEAGGGAFMLSPGDIDPPQAVYDDITAALGDGFDWYPVAGNHETETPEDMTWLRSFNAGGTTLPRIVNAGPPGCVETCYSFDWGLAHFAVLNEYFDGSSDVGSAGEVGPALMSWLQADLAATTQPVIFVVGHEPAYPQPDAEPPHRLRHETDSLNQFPATRDIFWQALAARGVTAYICGHTHDYSVVLVDGVWQIDCGHARGTGDKGARSTIMRIKVDAAGAVSYETWRLDLATGEYSLADTGGL